MTPWQSRERGEQPLGYSLGPLHGNRASYTGIWRCDPFLLVFGTVGLNPKELAWPLPWPLITKSAFCSCLVLTLSLLAHCLPWFFYPFTLSCGNFWIPNMPCSGCREAGALPHASPPWQCPGTTLLQVGHDVIRCSVSPNHSSFLSDGNLFDITSPILSRLWVYKALCSDLQAGFWHVKGSSECLFFPPTVIIVSILKRIYFETQCWSVMSIFFFSWNDKFGDGGNHGKTSK